MDVGARAPLRRGAPAPLWHAGQRAGGEFGRSSAWLRTRHQLQPGPRAQKALGIPQKLTRAPANPQRVQRRAPRRGKHLRLSRANKRRIVLPFPAWSWREHLKDDPLALQETA